MTNGTSVQYSGRVASGQGKIRVRSVAGQSAVVSAQAASPLKILVPRPRGPSTSAYFSSFGGGLVAGDEIRLRVELEDHCRCYLSTQASTKVYRNPDARPCGHSLDATVGEKSLLVLAPDPVQAFRGSLYRQQQRFHLNSSGGLVLVDWVSSGRAECGERWAFTRYESRNELFVDEHRAFLDSLSLDPADGPIENPCRMGRFNCLALLMLAGEMVHGAAERMLSAVAEMPIPRHAALLCSASPIANGALLRIAGERVEDVRRELHHWLDFLPPLLHDDPRARKW
jgi:urease accessory protein